MPLSRLYRAPNTELQLFLRGPRSPAVKMSKSRRHSISSSLEVDTAGKTLKRSLCARITGHLAARPGTEGTSVTVHRMWPRSGGFLSCLPIRCPSFGGPITRRVSFAARIPSLEHRAAGEPHACVPPLFGDLCVIVFLDLQPYSQRWGRPHSQPPEWASLCSPAV